jgi:alpha-galactosidase
MLKFFYLACLVLMPLQTSAHSTEIHQKHDWLQKNLIDAKANPPFSFIYGGTPSVGLLRKWHRQTDKSQENERRTYTFSWRDIKTGLLIRCEAVEYNQFPVLEWTIWFKNTGSENTPIIEDIQGLDIRMRCKSGQEFSLHHWRGDFEFWNNMGPELYEPLLQILSPQSTFRVSPHGGRPCSAAFPYFNLQSQNNGLLLAVGWPGQWSAAFTRESGKELHILAGQERTHLYLKPGEEIRSPLIALLFWQGQDDAHAYNLWRRWMWQYQVPRTPGGGAVPMPVLPQPMLIGNSSFIFREMQDANETNQKQFIDRYLTENIKIDYWWMDAGWYPNFGSWENTGTWEPDSMRFPRGLRAISDHGNSKGVKTLVWFEPERAKGETWLRMHHPEWLLDGTLLNLANPAAAQWLTDHIDHVITEQGIDIYRQDFNIDPLEYWRKNDSPDRQGLTENRHVQAYLAFFDSLRKRHPKLIIDGCAGGGRRMDLESLRRTVILHPTDYKYNDSATKQAFHQTLFQWIPFYGANSGFQETINPYAFRSSHTLSIMLAYDMRRTDLDYELLKKLCEEWKSIAPCYYGDFYPLTMCTRTEDTWMAWQFHLPDEDKGIIEVFRRSKNDHDNLILQLKGLKHKTKYRVTDVDSGFSTMWKGRDLMEKGIAIKIESSPGSALVIYQKIEESGK